MKRIEKMRNLFMFYKIMSCIAIVGIISSAVSMIDSISNTDMLRGMLYLCGLLISLYVFIYYLRNLSQLKNK